MSTLAAAWIVLGIGSARAGSPTACDAPSTNEQVAIALEQAATAYEKLDADGFEAAVQRGRDATSCLREPISRSNAAELHRALGMLSFVRGEMGSSELSFAAARTIEPAYVFPTTRVPEGNPLLTTYAARDLAEHPQEPVAAPAEGSLRLDGSSVLKRHAGLPVVYQRLDRAGAIELSTILGGADPVPSLPALDARPEPASGGFKPHTPSLIAGLIAGAAAGGTYGASLAAEKSYFAADTPELLDSRRTTVHGLTIGAGTLTGAAVALVSFSLLKGRF